MNDEFTKNPKLTAKIRDFIRGYGSSKRAWFQGAVKGPSPKLTAYALGELEDEQECRDIAKALELSEELRREVEEIRETAALVVIELAKEPSLGLSAKHRDRIESELSASSRPSIFPLRLKWGMSFAASFILVMVLLMVMFNQSGVQYLRLENGPGLSDPERDNYQIEGLYEILEKSDPEAVFYSRLLMENLAKPGDIGVNNDRIDDSAFNREGRGNSFLSVAENPLSTFSIDVDTASYSNMRRFLNSGTLPSKDTVRIEEMINYFSYDYPDPEGEQPFSVHTEVAQAPWRPEHRLLKVGLKGREMAWEQRPSSNLVFLLDVSGSMEPDNKLPLLKDALRLLLQRLGENDRVALVVYAGASGLVLPSTPADQKERILSALEQLEAGGSTHGSAGIQLAYETAIANFIPGGINRVVLATDGDFNVGITDQGALTQLIEEKAQSGVFLSVLGFGMDNYRDSILEKLADQGNGNYAYIDTLGEARKVLVEEIHSTLVTIAKDVKIQIEFNPLQVAAYRLVGYENRLLDKEDFNNDTKDAGEIGAGHTVTALYEIVPAAQEAPVESVDALRYQRRETTEKAATGELLTLKLRYKDPEATRSQLLESVVHDSGRDYARASQDFKFAAAVASFGMLLRESPHKGTTTLESVLELAVEGKGADAHGYRSEFLELVRKARPQIGADPPRE